jgi:DNA-binding NarL/FixJ family response regulator
MKKARVLLADDHSLFREGMTTLLNCQPDFSVVAEASDGLEAIEKARELRPDLVLMDIALPRCDCPEATRRIMADAPEVVILLLTVRELDERLFAAIKNGAQGYLLKSLHCWEIVDLLRDAMKGHVAITQALAGRMLEEFRRMSRPAARDTPEGKIMLTRQEGEVLRLVADGVADKEIAQALALSVHTVKSHMRDILAKLHQGHQHQAARPAAKEDSSVPPE